jgi:hypothetical protein
MCNLLKNYSRIAHKRTPPERRDRKPGTGATTLTSGALEPAAPHTRLCGPDGARERSRLRVRCAPNDARVKQSEERNGRSGGRQCNCEGPCAEVNGAGGRQRRLRRSWGAVTYWEIWERACGERDFGGAHSVPFLPSRELNATGPSPLSLGFGFFSPGSGSVPAAHSGSLLDDFHLLSALLIILSVIFQTPNLQLKLALTLECLFRATSHQRFFYVFWKVEDMAPWNFSLVGVTVQRLLVGMIHRSLEPLPAVTEDHRFNFHWRIIRNF